VTGPGASICVHCGDPNPPGEKVSLKGEGELLEFCCRGCRTAYRVITEAGLAEFYTRRCWDEDGVPAGVFDSTFSDEYLEQYVRIEKDGARLAVLVEGVRCASCVWVIEKILAKVRGVVRARISNTTHVLTIIFDRETVKASQLFARIAELGYMPRPHTSVAAEEAARKEMRSLLVRFGTAVFLSMQLMGYSLGLYAGYFKGMDEGTRTWLQYLAGLVSTPVVFYCGWPFLKGAIRSFRNRAADMDLLVATGVLSAWLYSVYAMFTGGEVYFDSAAMIVTFLLLGRLLESFARRKAASGVARILRLAPETAARIEGGKPVLVPAGSLVPGDHVLVAPGDRFPADGLVKEGVTEVDESAVSGEPFPVPRAPGQEVVSGTVNLTASVSFVVTAAGSESFVSRVAQLVEDAQSRKPSIQRMTDRVAAWFVPVVLLLAVATFVYWTLREGPGALPLLTAVSVLVVACPCALGLATPTAVVVASGAAAGKGILFKGGDVLQELARSRITVFDKTGTLTGGRPRVAGSAPAEGVSEKELFLSASRAEAGSSHPIAGAILARAEELGVDPQAAAGAKVVPGRGVILETAGGTVLVGSEAHLAEAGIPVPVDDDPGSRTEALVSEAGRFLGRIYLDDELREEAPRALASFRQLMKRILILSGDRPDAVESVAGKLAIDEGKGFLSPEEKAAEVKVLQLAGDRVFMVGDGINDAPALAEASVGCAISGGSDVALEVSDVVLTRPRLDVAALAVRISRRTLTVIKQNLAWAMVYNVAAIGLAMAGKLAPIHAAAAMALSSICVVANSLRLARVKS
jgi:Cu2+-exporting ATPase